MARALWPWLALAGLGCSTASIRRWAGCSRWRSGFTAAARRRAAVARSDRARPCRRGRRGGGAVARARPRGRRTRCSALAAAVLIGWAHLAPLTATAIACASACRPASSGWPVVLPDGDRPRRRPDADSGLPAALPLRRARRGVTAAVPSWRSPRSAFIPPRCWPPSPPSRSSSTSGRPRLPAARLDQSRSRLDRGAGGVRRRVARHVTATPMTEAGRRSARRPHPGRLRRRLLDPADLRRAPRLRSRRCLPRVRRDRAPPYRPRRAAGRLEDRLHQPHDLGRIRRPRADLGPDVSTRRSSAVDPTRGPAPLPHRRVGRAAHRAGDRAALRRRAASGHGRDGAARLHRRRRPRLRDRAVRLSGWRFTAADTVAAFALHGRLRHGPLRLGRRRTSAPAGSPSWRTSRSRFPATARRSTAASPANVLDGPLSALPPLRARPRRVSDRLGRPGRRYRHHRHDHARPSRSAPESAGRRATLRPAASRHRTSPSRARPDSRAYRARTWRLHGVMTRPAENRYRSRPSSVPGSMLGNDDESRRRRLQRTSRNSWHTSAGQGM